MVTNFYVSVYGNGFSLNVNPTGSYTTSRYYSTFPSVRVVVYGLSRVRLVVIYVYTASDVTAIQEL